MDILLLKTIELLGKSYKNMKIIVFTEGGKEYGYGHLSRCIALFQALEGKLCNCEVLFVVKGDLAAESFLKKEKITDYLFVDWTDSTKGILDEIRKEDIVIIDSYIAEKGIYDEISLIVEGKVLMIDDYNRINYPSGIVVNPSIYGRNVDYQKQNNTVYLLGEDYVILRKAFWEVPEKRINEDIRKILISLGGGIEHEFLKKMSDFLKTKHNFDLMIINPEKQNMSAEEMVLLMHEADICISGGGQTLYELARVGVPTISICLAGNQEANLRAWEEKGFIQYVKVNNNDHLFENIADSIKGLKDKGKRVNVNKIGNKIVDGKGAANIAEFLIGEFNL